MKTLKVPPAFARHAQTEKTVHRPTLSGHKTLILVGLAIGLLLMGIQLHLLSVALDFYLSGLNSQIWLPVLASGASFLGGLMILWVLRQQLRAPRKGTALKER